MRGLRHIPLAALERMIHRLSCAVEGQFRLPNETRPMSGNGTQLKCRHVCHESAMRAKRTSIGRHPKSRFDPKRTWALPGGFSFGESRLECPLLMLWTAPPPARECHGCGCCQSSHDSEELFMRTMTTIGLDIAKS